MKTLFTRIFDYFERHKTIYWLCFVVVFILCIAGAARIRFVNDINRMIPHDASIEAMNNVLNKTKTGEQIVFTFSFKESKGPDPDSLITLQQSFQEMMRKDLGNAIKSIWSQADEAAEMRFMELAIQYLPLFLQKEDYAHIDSLIRPEAIKSTLRKDHELLLSPAGIMAKNWIAQDPVGIVPIALSKFRSLNYDPDYQLYNGYIFDKKLSRITFFIELENPASATGKNEIFFRKLDDHIAAFQSKNPGLHISYFGAPAVAAGNALQMRNDTLLTLSITVALLLLLTFYVFRRKRAPFLLIVPVVFGGLFGMAVTAMVQGEVSVIALGAGAIILGIAIDFSVHFMSHARIHPDMRENVKTLVFPLTLGAFTTIGAFYALRFCNAPLLKDLGTFAAASLTGASLFTLIFLPHLLKDTRHKTRDIRSNNITFIDRLAGVKPEGNKWLLLFVLLATPVLWYFATKVQFDSNLMHLNYMSPKLQQAQDELNRNNAYALSSVFVVATGSSDEAAKQKLETVAGAIQQLQAEGKIRNSINPAIILPSQKEQEERLQRWSHYWNTGKVKQTLDAVNNNALDVGFSADAFSAFTQTLQQPYHTFDSADAGFLQSMVPNAKGSDSNEHYAIATLKVAPGARTAVLNAFNKNAAVIATDRQAVSEKLLGLLKKDFNKVLLYSGLLVFLALLIAYGRIELALISFLPMALTWVWILGIMSITGMKFNIVNIIISTLIFGLGDDYSIFMMDSLMEKYRTGKSDIAHARSAVYLSVATTVIGLGTLIFAKHPALHSIALISITGLVCVVFVSQVLQPFLFNFMIQRRADKGFMPFTLWSLLKSAFSFLYFFTGCLIVTIAGLVLTGLRPFGKAKSKYIFHYILSKYTGSVMYVMTNVKKRIIVPDKNIFNRPAVYIANHSSFLDILLTTMLHPKLVLLTNKWVWRSPVFGKIVRMAEYFPVADGAEDSIEPLKDLANRGYGIIVFPEGTRSYDDSIHRFHKGAFYIAEQLQLDVVPILMHGVHYTMQKGDWLLKDGTTTVRVLPAIKGDDANFGSTYSERAKKIMRWFRERFKEEKIKNETPSYFYEQITKSNIYKGPVLEWYCKVKVKLENCYEPFHTLLPREGFFYDLGCGYGFMTYMLHWASEGRRFIGVDYDEDKIITAQNNYVRIKTPDTRYKAQDLNNENLISHVPDLKSHISHLTSHISFEHADVTQYNLQVCNGIIVSDVLHYLLPEQQTNLLNKCYDALLSDGILIIRDGVEELTERHKGTRLTEKFSTQVFGFNKTQNELHYISRSFIESWAAEKKLALEVIDNTKKTSNLIFVLRKP